MAYLIYAIDHENKDTQREHLRDAHRDHLKYIGKKLLASGALLNDEGTNVIGGISLLDTDDRKEAEGFANNDPYGTAGIRKEIKIVRWRRRWIDGEFQMSV